MNLTPDKGNEIMSISTTTRTVAQGDPVTSEARTMFDAKEIPLLSDTQERCAAAYEDNWALQKGFHDRAELLELSTAAYSGLVELARRTRQTEFGRKGFPKRRSFGDYLAWLFGEDRGPDGEYASAYTYALQTIRPFIRNVHCGRPS
ncbi:hypothetical protein [Methylobacterium mesophilicum]